MTDIDVVDLLAAELRSFLIKRVNDVVDPEAMPQLCGCIERWLGKHRPQAPGGGVCRVMDAQPMMDEAIGLVGDAGTRERLSFLLADSELRYRSVKERGSRAAKSVGVGYDAYRRVNTGKMTSDLAVLARHIVDLSPAIVSSVPAVSPGLEGTEQSAVVSSSEGAAVESSAVVEESAAEGAAVSGAADAALRTSRRNAVLAAVAAVVLVVAVVVAIRGGDGRGGDIVEAQLETVDGGSAGADADEDSDPVTTAAAEIADGAAETAAVETHDVETHDVEARSVEEYCRKPGFIDGDPTAELLVAVDAVVAMSGELPDGVCADEALNKRGLVYWQRLSIDRRLAGGLLVFEDESGTMVSTYLTMGLWQSYFRIGGSDGSRSVEMGGYPTGDVVAVGDHFEMEISGAVVLIAEESNGTFYWMPQIAYIKWQESEATDSALGWPTSSVYTSDGSYRVDFTTGYIVQNFDGELEAVLIEPGEAHEGLPAGEAIASHLISSIDGTAWYVDSELKRWWISDEQTWECAGGGSNQVAQGLPGYSIHSLVYGGIFRCPAEGASSWPARGGVDLNLFCHDTYGPAFVAELRDDGWVCDNKAESRPAVQYAVCRWQYGPEAIAKVDSNDNRHFSCEQSA